MALRRRANGSWIVDYYDPHGQRRYVGLGKISKRAAQEFYAKFERLRSYCSAGLPPDGELVQWLRSLPRKLHAKLVRLGLCREDLGGSMAVAELVEWYLEYSKDRVKQSTWTHYRNGLAPLVEFLGHRPIIGITVGDCEDYREFLRAKKGLAQATVNRRLTMARTVFRQAVRRGWLGSNPWELLRVGGTSNPERLRFVDQETVQQVIDACPDAQWRLLVALARYGGLRIHEALHLQWEDVLWDRKRLVIRSSKTERSQTRGIRYVPIFPELEPYLRECFEQAPAGETFVIWRYKHLAARAKSGDWRVANLRPQLERIICRAGVPLWPRLWQNLRASRASELALEYPEFVCNAWLGHMDHVADKHYRMVLEQCFEKAARARHQFVTESAESRASRADMGS